MPEVIVNNASGAVRVPARDVARLAGFVARREGCRVSLVDLSIVGSRRMRGLNRRYLGHAWATDVLSFDLSDADRPGLAVQLVVSADAARTEGPPHGHSPREELLLYVVHGLLHVMGYEDATVRGRARLRARQDELLEAFLRGEKPPRPGARSR